MLFLPVVDYGANLTGIDNLACSMRIALASVWTVESEVFSKLLRYPSSKMT